MNAKACATEWYRVASLPADRLPPVESCFDSRSDDALTTCPWRGEESRSSSMHSQTIPESPIPRLR